MKYVGGAWERGYDLQYKYTYMMCALFGTASTHIFTVYKSSLSTLVDLSYPATDHGQISETAGCVNHHANRIHIYNVSLLALPFPFLSCYPSWPQIVGANNRCILVSSVLRWSKLQHPCVLIPPFKRTSIPMYFVLYAPWALNRMWRDRGRIIQAAGYLWFSYM